MNTDSWFILALIVADLLILARFYFDLRSCAPWDQRTLFPVAGVMLGFSFFGFLGSSSVGFVHLTTTVVAFGICLFWTFRRKDQTHPDA
jgi:hypothetical protein